MATVARGGERMRYFLWAGGAAIAVAFAGFFRTVLWPSVQGPFEGPAVRYVHGAFVLGWLLLFASQAWWVHARQVARHRQLGMMAAVVAPGVVVSTMALGVFAMRRDLDAGLGEMATSQMVGTFASSLVFFALVAAGLAWRRRPDVHKRLMLLATIVILWPAFFRFRHYFPGVPRPDWVFGVGSEVVFLGTAMLADRLRLGRIHPVYFWVGLPVIAEAALETWLFDGAGWRMLAHWLAGLFQ